MARQVGLDTASDDLWQVLNRERVESMLHEGQRNARRKGCNQLFRVADALLRASGGRRIAARLNRDFLGRLFTCEVLMNVPSTLLSALHTSVRVVDNRLNRLELRRKKRGLGLREERDRSLEFVSRVFDCDARAFLQELESSAFRVEYRRRLGQLDSEIPGHSDGTSSDFDCETLYVTVRAARPSVVVETGVLFGAFSAHILEARPAVEAATLLEVRHA